MMIIGANHLVRKINLNARTLYEKQMRERDGGGIIKNDSICIITVGHGRIAATTRALYQKCHINLIA